eukprot:g1139.t1
MMQDEYRRESFTQRFSREKQGDNDNKNEELADVMEVAKSRMEVEVPLEEKRADGTAPWISFKVLWAYTGPGFLMSLAYLDPGNLEADLQSGAYAGYQLLWMLFWATAAGLVLQILAARLGVVTGMNLAEMCRLEYGNKTRVLLWIMTEIAIIGSDIQEVVGSAIAFKILFGWELWIGTIVTGLDTFTFLILQYFGMRKLEALFVALVLTMTACFWINFGVEGPEWAGVPTSNSSGSILFGTAVPTVEDYALLQAVGLLGAVIMPHNIYLHSALVQSRKVDRGSDDAVGQACKYNAIDSSLSLLLSFFINVAVVAVFAKGFFNKAECARPGWDLNTFSYDHGAPDIDQVGSSNNNLGCLPVNMSQVHLATVAGNATTPFDDLDGCHRLAGQPGAPFMHCETGTGLPGVCCEIGLGNAADALRGVMGEAAPLIWAVGLLAAGQASTMTGTFAGQFVMEGFMKWKLKPWMRVVFTRTIALGPAIAVALISATDRSAGDSLDEWLNILQSVQLPFALLPVLHFTNSERVMGRFANRGCVKTLVCALAIRAITINAYLVASFVTDPANPTPTTWWFFMIVIILGLLYFWAMYVIVAEDLRDFWRATIGRFCCRRGSDVAGDSRTALLVAGESA